MLPGRRPFGSCHAASGSARYARPSPCSHSDSEARIAAGRRAVITSSGRCWLRSGPRPQSCGQLAGLYFYTSPPTSRTYYSAADRVFLDRRDAGAPLVEHAAQARGPLAVRLTAGRGAGDEWPRPRPGHSDAVDLRGLHPCQAPDPGTSPGNVTAEAGRLRFGPPGCGRAWLPAASAPCRRSVRLQGRGRLDRHPLITGWPAWECTCGRRNCEPPESAWSDHSGAPLNVSQSRFVTRSLSAYARSPALLQGTGQKNGDPGRLSADILLCGQPTWLRPSQYGQQIT